MKTRPVVADSEGRRAAESGPYSGPAWVEKHPSAPYQGEVLCGAKGRVLGGSIFRLLREGLGAIIMITDPEKVRETLGLLENEPEAGRVTRTDENSHQIWREI